MIEITGNHEKNKVYLKYIFRILWVLKEFQTYSFFQKRIFQTIEKKSSSYQIFIVDEKKNVYFQIYFLDYMGVTGASGPV